MRYTEETLVLLGLMIVSGCTPVESNPSQPSATPPAIQATNTPQVTPSPNFGATPPSAPTQTQTPTTLPPFTPGGITMADCPVTPPNGDTPPGEQTSPGFFGNGHCGLDCGPMATC